MRPPLVDRLLAAFLPWRCVLCRDAAAGMDLCIDCLNDLPWLGATCRLCGLPLPVSGLRVCGSCCIRPPPVSRCVVALAYEFPVAEMVSAMKFAKQRCFARVLGGMLAVRLHELNDANLLELPDAVLPVPLSRWRHYSRGFNQAEIMAAEVCLEFSLELDTVSLSRIRHTPPQSGLRKTVRRKNIRGAFQANMKRLQNKRIAIVDDVITTGSTINEVVRTLRHSGVKDIQIWAVARA